jgi:hypothetical protein
MQDIIRIRLKLDKFKLQLHLVVTEIEYVKNKLLEFENLDPQVCIVPWALPINRNLHVIVLEYCIVNRDKSMKVKCLIMNMVQTALIISCIF